MDPVETSAKWAQDKGFSDLTLLCDPDMKVIDAWDLHNAQEPGLALHAVYVIDAEGTITYRKVARRRTRSPELLMAIDAEPVECCASRCPKGEPVCRARATRE